MAPVEREEPHAYCCPGQLVGYTPAILRFIQVSVHIFPILLNGN